LRRANPDVVITEGFFQWTPAALWWTRRSGAALVLAYERTAHTERRAGALRTAYRRLVARWVDAACCNGSLSRDYCSGHLGIPESRIVVGGMAAEPEYLRRHATEFTAFDCIGVGSLPRPRFLFAGRLEYGKGIDTLLTAWRELSGRVHSPHTGSLIVAGDGSELQGAKAYVSAYGLRGVHFLGKVPYRTLGGLYESSDVLVLPTREDNWSLVVAEAMAFGKPVVTTTANGCWPELVVPGRTGWLIDADDVGALVGVLEECTQGFDELQRRGAEAKAVVSKYTPETAALAFLQAVQLAVSRRPRNSSAET